ncbi:MAG: VCBS repeat-containing protein, partial [Planctomycetes bacterium]|nr:VCBS repeat-containing protein [Planctomycetota bacterium]
MASCLARLCGTALGVPPFEFADVSASKGIGSYIMAEGMGGGAAAADFDDDGDIDLFVPTGAGVPDQLYRNLGNGQFEEIAQQAGLDSTVANRTALWFDYDADGVLDLLVANDVEDSPTMYRLYRQVASGQFEDVTVEAGLII